MLGIDEGRVMTNEEYIKNMSTWDLAEFIYDVSNNATKITNCDKECAKCEYSDAWCISEIGEWLKEQKNE